MDINVKLLWNNEIRLSNPENTGITFSVIKCVPLPTFRHQTFPKTSPMTINSQRVTRDGCFPVSLIPLLLKDFLDKIYIAYNAVIP